MPSRAGRRGSGSASRSRPASAAAAPTPRPRCRLANETLAEPLPPERLHELAAELGADVPFFLTSGPQLGTGTGTELEPLELPQDYWVVLLLPDGQRKPSTADVYAELRPPRRRRGVRGAARAPARKRSPR